MKSVDVVQPTVPRFRNDGKRPEMACGLMLHAPVDDGVADDADTVRVGKCDRTFEKAGLLNPCGAVISPLPFSLNQPA